MRMLFEKADYEQLKNGETYEGKIVVVNPDFFNDDYREAKWQLFKCKSGFGCDPAKIGSKIFGHFIDGEDCITRQNVLGVATEKAIKDWELYYGLKRSMLN